MFSLFFLCSSSFFCRLGTARKLAKIWGSEKDWFLFSNWTNSHPKSSSADPPGHFFLFLFFSFFLLPVESWIFEFSNTHVLATHEISAGYDPSWKDISTWLKKNDPVKNKKPDLANKKTTWRRKPWPGKKNCPFFYATWRIQEVQGPRICTAYSTSRTQGSGSSCQCVRSN